MYSHAAEAFVSQSRAPSNYGLALCSSVLPQTDPCLSCVNYCSILIASAFSLHQLSAACSHAGIGGPVYSAMMTFPGVHFKHFAELAATEVPHPCVQVRPTLLCLIYRIIYKLNKTTWVSESQQSWHQFPSFPWGVSHPPHPLHLFLLFFLLCFLPQEMTASLTQLPTPFLELSPSIC